MKRFLYIIMCVLSVAACDKLPENGKLDGMWQLRELTPAATGIAQDKSHDGIYWSFQLSLCVIHSAQTPIVCAFGTDTVSTFNITALFAKNDGHLHLNTLYAHEFAEDREIVDPDFSALKMAGVYGNRDDYAILRLTDKEMLLQSDSCTLRFRKF